MVFERRLGVVLVFTRNTHLLPPVCVCTSDTVRWTVHALSLLIHATTHPPCHHFKTHSAYVVCQVQAALALACTMCTEFRNSQPLKNVLMLLGVSQVMLHLTSHSAACGVYMRKQTGCWVGRSPAPHLCNMAGRRAKEECSHTQVQGGGFECASCRLDKWRCLCVGFQLFVVYLKFQILLLISKRAAVSFFTLKLWLIGYR